MSEPITGSAVAIALMREALSLLDTEETAIAAEHLQRAIKAAEEAPPPPPEEPEEGQRPPA